MLHKLLTHNLLKPSLAFTVALVVLLVAGVSSAQHSLGTKFWVADNVDKDIMSENEFGIVIVNPGTEQVDCTISNPLIPTPTESIDVTVPPGESSVNLFPPVREWCGLPPCTLRSFDPVYRIECPQNVSVYSFDTWQRQESNDSSIALPEEQLGTHYHIASYLTPQPFPWGSYIAVINTSGLNEITFRDRTNAVRHAVNLIPNEYYLYHVGVNSLNAEDATGWTVSSDYPIAVYGAEFCSVIGEPQSVCDQTIEQLFPTENLETDEYIVCPSRTRPVETDGSPCAGGSCAPDVFRFISTSPRTDLTIEPAGACELTGGGENRFDFLFHQRFTECYSDTPFKVTGTDDFTAYQYLVSQESLWPDPMAPEHPAADTGDPSLVTVMPTHLYQCSYLIEQPTDQYPHDFINVALPDTATLFNGAEALDPMCIPAGTVDGVAYSCCAIEVDDGTTGLWSTEPFGLMVSAFEQYTSHAYTGGGATFVCDAGGPYEPNTCTGSTVELAGLVSPCADCLPATTTWTGDPALVTFDDPADLNTTATITGCGPVEICLEGACPAGQESSCCTTISLDTEPPALNVPKDDCLWPPNHKYVCYENFAQSWLAGDNCPGGIDLEVQCSSNQCEDAPCSEYPGQNGDGNTIDDCTYDVENDILCVRSERAGTDPDGREYSVSVTASDGCGNESSGVMTIAVPHDQNPHMDCSRP